MYSYPKPYVPDIRSPPATISSWGTVPTYPPPHQPPFYPGSVYSGPGSPGPSSIASIASSTFGPSWRAPGPYDVRCPHRFHPQLVAQPFNPRTTRMRLSVEGYPTWVFDIEKQSEILVEDVLNWIYCQFNDPLESQRFLGVPPEAAAKASRNFQRRAAASRSDFSGGVKRLDCLDFKYNFIGMTQTGSGTWIVHFSS